MPIKYIGRTHDFRGKTLWEIVGNLKYFGVGRIFNRNKFVKRYSEPTYHKILKVEALPAPRNVANPFDVSKKKEFLFLIEPRLSVKYNLTNNLGLSRIAEEGEVPDFEIKMGLGTPASPRLYTNI
ncbi:uncharacterized protein LOC117169965 [Belonocnema kinseyi]|uniref:uncharacterized protein LOC117169965 n=1 Tax=Belonocnema kinseyi TaxID=2817044 RepID=UPI00143CD4EF|nr:uncharacterized protein LOC117169965 [Belonocnema kinseyi]